MRTITFLLWFIVIFFLYRSLKRIFLSNRKQKTSDQEIYSKQRSSIDKKNIVDADFEDVTDKETKKS